MKRKRCTAILLAAGNGKRMKSCMRKQFMPLAGKPLIWYPLLAVEASDIIDDCILVTGKEDIPYMKKEIVDKYHFRKVTEIVAGGEERCFSVANGLNALGERHGGYVFIHDGARPFLTETLLKNTYEAVQKYHACVAAVPVKDTIKIGDGEGFAAATPPRNRLWTIQTPQVFDVELITRAYGRLTEQWDVLREKGITVTDDAGVVELFTDVKVKLVESTYDNIKLTTQEDIFFATSLIRPVF